MSINVRLCLYDIDVCGRDTKVALGWKHVLDSGTCETADCDQETADYDHWILSRIFQVCGQEPASPYAERTNLNPAAASWATVSPHPV